MKSHDQTEIAYKNGYEKGYADALASTKQKIKTHFAKIIVEGTSAEPYYSILYYDPTKKEYYNGYGSYYIWNVFRWMEEEFEIVDGDNFATDNNVGDKVSPTDKDINVPSKWISVKERLPDKDGHYLCNYHFGEYPKMTFTQVLDYYATDIVPHFQHTLGDGSMKVTHWIPLPLPPEGE